MELLKALYKDSLKDIILRMQNFSIFLSPFPQNTGANLRPSPPSHISIPELCGFLSIAV